MKMKISHMIPTHIKTKRIQWIPHRVLVGYIVTDIHVDSDVEEQSVWTWKSKSWLSSILKHGKLAYKAQAIWLFWAIWLDFSLRTNRVLPKTPQKKHYNLQEWKIFCLKTVILARCRVFFTFSTKLITLISTNASRLWSRSRKKSTYSFGQRVESQQNFYKFNIMFFLVEYITTPFRVFVRKRYNLHKI